MKRIILISMMTLFLSACPPKEHNPDPEVATEETDCQTTCMLYGQAGHAFGCICAGRVSIGHW